MNPRVICWFSCGDASAVATKLVLRKHPDAMIVRIVLTTEHPDNDRFAADCERWYGKEIVNIASTEYRDTWQVWEKRRYISGIHGAPCTTELKKKVRREFQRPDDIHVWGFTIEEKNRADRFRNENPELTSLFPLIDAQLDKADCHSLVRGAGIELPVMYQIGFPNNNCIACGKAQGAGYWNLTRVHFPVQFDRMAKLSRAINCRLVKYKGQRIFLDELPADAGIKPELEISCSPFCETTALAIAS